MKIDKEKLLAEIEYRLDEYSMFRYEPMSRVVIMELQFLKKWITEMEEFE